jgi:GDP/UDP-N,N'-diacetylbacillosamine 2-epimerase (hydrolysing)
VGGFKLKNILVLTSSRADYGIYLPLLKELRLTEEIQFEILAFGTHLSAKHGYTINEILKDGFTVQHQVEIPVEHDGPEDIALCFAKTVEHFSRFWAKKGKDYDWIIVLGDRFEMAAAVAAGIPFVLPFAHIHGGETTLGAIDNIYRHFITLSSSLHFVSLPAFKERVIEIVGEQARCFVVGALGLDNLSQMPLLSKDEFYKKWQIDLAKPSVLITIHPETVAFDDNVNYANESEIALNQLANQYQLIVTMPNADTYGNLYRKMFQTLKEKYPTQIHLIENFGTESYFTAMKHVGLMLGNTSSGITEGSSFQKYVLNIGDRQKGRIAGENVIHTSFNSKEIIEKVNQYFGKSYTENSIYFKGGASKNIVKELISNEY